MPDSDATAFLTAAGITDPTQSSAVDQLVVDLKAAGIWAKCAAIYPFVGGTAAKHKWNLKDPRDLDVAYRLTFGANFTHSATGAQPIAQVSGVNGMDTKMAGSTLNKLDAGFCYYSRTNSDDFGADFGTPGTIVAGFQVLTRVSNTWYHDVPTYTTDRTSVAMATSTGLFASSLTATDVRMFRNGAMVKARGAATSSSFSAETLRFSTGWPGGNRNSIRELAFAAVMSSALTDGEHAALYTAVELYQYGLGRHLFYVPPPTTLANAVQATGAGSAQSLTSTQALDSGFAAASGSANDSASAMSRTAESANAVGAAELLTANHMLLSEVATGLSSVANSTAGVSSQAGRAAAVGAVTAASAMIVSGGPWPGIVSIDSTPILQSVAMIDVMPETLASALVSAQYASGASATVSVS